MKKWIGAVTVLSAICFGLSSAEAADKWLIRGNTVWVSGDSRLTLEMPSVFHPYLKVTSSSAGDFQWIETTVPYVFGSTIKQIALCFQTPNVGTFISQIRLADYTLPTPATVRFDDGTDLFDPAGSCYFTSEFSYTPDPASVNLSLRLNFASPEHEIRLGGLAIRVIEP